MPSPFASEKIRWLSTIQFRSGAGGGTDGYCVEEALACALGLPVSDRCPDCVEPTLHGAGIRVNDSWVWKDPDLNKAEQDAARTDTLMPFLLAQPNTRTTDATVRQERRRLVVDFAVHVAVPAWMRAAGLEQEAVACEALPSWSPETMSAIREQMRKSRTVAAAAAAAAADAVAVAVAYAAAAAVADAVADAVAVAYAAADAAAYAAADAAAVAWRKKHRPLATRLLKEYVRVLIQACAVESPAPQEPTP